MSLAWYIVPEREIPGFDTFANGKALAKANDVLEAIATRHSVRPLMSFFSPSTDEVIAFAQSEGANLPKAIEKTWFTAEEGLRTVNLLLESVEKDSTSGRVVKDLEDFRRVLETLRKCDVRWHLAVDF